MKLDASLVRNGELVVLAVVAALSAKPSSRLTLSGTRDDTATRKRGRLNRFLDVLLSRKLRVSRLSAAVLPPYMTVRNAATSNGRSSLLSATKTGM